MTTNRAGAGRPAWPRILALGASVLLLVGAYGALPPSGGSELPVGGASAGPSTYPVNFTEQYLPAGTNWSLAIGSQTWNTSHYWVVVAEPNGTFSYTASTPTDASYAPVTGTFVVNGAPINVTVGNTTAAPGGSGPPPSAASSNSGSSAGGWVSAAVLLGVVLFVIIAGLLLVRRGRASSDSEGGSGTASPAADPSQVPADLQGAPDDSDPMGHML